MNGVGSGGRFEVGVISQLTRFTSKKNYLAFAECVHALYQFLAPRPVRCCWRLGLLLERALRDRPHPGTRRGERGKRCRARVRDRAFDGERSDGSWVDDCDDDSTRRAPVVDAEGGVVGVIAMDDAVALVTNLLCDLSGLIRQEQRIERRTHTS